MSLNWGVYPFNSVEAETPMVYKNCGEPVWLPDSFDQTREQLLNVLERGFMERAFSVKRSNGLLTVTRPFGTFKFDMFGLSKIDRLYVSGDERPAIHYSVNVKNETIGLLIMGGVLQVGITASTVISGMYIPALIWPLCVAFVIWGNSAIKKRIWRSFIIAILDGG